MNIFNGYLEGDERNLAIESAKLENEYTKLTTLFEMTQLQVEQMHRDAEMKVFEEAGTYDDLTYLYQEADAEVNEQRKNILQKIIDWFAKIFSKIGNAIKNFFTMGDADTEVEAPVEVVEKVGALEKCWSNMQNGLAKLRNGDFSGALDILKVVALPATIAVGGAVTYKKYKKGELDGIVKKLDGIKEKAQSAFDGIKSKISGLTNSDEQNNAQKSLNPFQKFISWINDAISKITSFVAGAIKGVKSGSSDAADAEDKKGESKEEKPADKGEQKEEPKANEAEIKHENKTYVIDLATGKVKSAIDDKTGKPFSYLMNATVERKIKRAMEKAQKNATSTESADGGFVLTTEAEAILRETFGEDAVFTIEGADLIVSNAKDIFEEEISVSESVFGVQAGDLVEESADNMDAFDKEMQELLDDFKNL